MTGAPLTALQGIERPVAVVYLLHFAEIQADLAAEIGADIAANQTFPRVWDDNDPPIPKEMLQRNEHFNVVVIGIFRIRIGQLKARLAAGSNVGRIRRKQKRCLLSDIADHLYRKAAQRFGKGLNLSRGSKPGRKMLAGQDCPAIQPPEVPPQGMLHQWQLALF